MPYAFILSIFTFGFFFWGAQVERFKGFAREFNVGLQSTQYLEQLAIAEAISNDFVIAAYSLLGGTFLVHFITVSVMKRVNKRSISLEFLAQWDEAKEGILNSSDKIQTTRLSQFLERNLYQMSIMRQRKMVARHRGIKAYTRYTLKREKTTFKDKIKSNYVFEGQDKGMSLLQQYSLIMNFLNRVYFLTIFMKRDKRKKMFMHFYILALKKIEDYNSCFFEISDTADDDWVSWSSFRKLSENFSKEAYLKNK